MTYGIAQIRQGVAAKRASGHATTMHLDLLAEALMKVGQSEEGMRVVVEALAADNTTGQGTQRGELYRLQGELLLRQTAPDAAQAEACFHQALVLARRQQAKSRELRAAMSLSRLWQRQGKRREARQLLAGVYAWFTEGFDTAFPRQSIPLCSA
jgi:predicted ATPase